MWTPLARAEAPRAPSSESSPQETPPVPELPLSEIEIEQEEQAQAESRTLTPREQTEEELANVHIGGPLALLGSGVGLVALGGSMVGIGFNIRNRCVFDTTCRHQTWIRLGGVALGAGVILATVGGVWFGGKLTEKRRLRRRLDEFDAAAPFKAKQNNERLWAFGITPSASGSQLQFRASF